MANAKNLRQIETLLEEIVADNGVDNTLKRGLEAFLATVMECEVSELTGAPPVARTGARAPDPAAARG